MEDSESGPTTEQLANFVCVRIWGPGYTRTMLAVTKSFLEDNLEAREVWLEQHREFQRLSNELGEKLREAGNQSSPSET